MSNALAIATVTATLADVVRRSANTTVFGTDVTIGRPQPPSPSAGRRIFLYLYQITPHAALRNDDLPTRRDETTVRRPQAAVVLHYLLVFQGSDTDLEPERMLGAVVRDLHARPVLSRDDIATAIRNRTVLADSNLGEAVERIRITPVTLSLEELSKLWGVFFQTPHAVSMTYEASVLLIEGEDTPRTPLPVLFRGVGDHGVTLVAGPSIAIARVRVGEPSDPSSGTMPAPYPSATLGRRLFVTGTRLAASPLRLRFRHVRLGLINDITVAPDATTSDALFVNIPSDAAAQSGWASGVLELTAIAGTGLEARTSNTLPLRLAPIITDIAPPSPMAPTVIDADNRTLTVTITCTPQVREEQHVVLLLAGREITAEPRTGQSGTLTFIIANPDPVQSAIVQLRIDGVDSMPFRRTNAAPGLEFDPTQMVTIT